MKVAILRYRRPIIVLLHLGLTVASNLLAFLLRFDGELPAEHLGPAFRALPLLLALRGVGFWAFSLFQGLWRYTSLWDLRNIIVSVTLSSAAFGVLVLSAGPAWGFQPYPRSVLVIDAGVLVCLLGGVRLLRRSYREFDRLQSEKRVLIYGAGDAGELIVRDIKNNRFYNMDPIGFVDDDPLKTGQSIHGVRVLGTGTDLRRIMEREQPHEVLVTIARAEPAELRAIVRSLEPFKVPIKTLPNLRDLIDGTVTVEHVRNLSLEDLMPRKPVGLDPEPVRRLISGRRVLVTGAGGSIGAELSRQLAGLGPSRLLLIDRYESALFHLCNDLKRLYPAGGGEAIIADVTDAARMEAIFREHAPEVVFHAAAHKHVPLMELNPSEAVKNNVRATRILAEAAVRAGVGDFVLISSDKAVNPSSVMGATKRVGELLIRAVNRTGRGRFVAVRFGNVLGSNGSVTRVFEEQIRRGGPVTVTHPDIRRYFMLISEAVQLVLHASAMRDEGVVYALDMGDQIRILDLARNLIRLSGFKPDEEIPIHFVGLRPGEKLYEELFERWEVAEPSAVANILRVRPQPVLPETLKIQIAQLEQAADQGRDADVLRILWEIVPTFRTTARTPSPRQAADGGRSPSVVQMPGGGEGAKTVGL